MWFLRIGCRSDTCTLCTYAFPRTSFLVRDPLHLYLMKAASYFWVFATLCAWWRVTVYLVEKAYGPDHVVTKFFPIGRTPMERRAPLVIPGLGEPVVKRSVPKPLPV